MTFSLHYELYRVVLVSTAMTLETSIHCVITGFLFYLLTLSGPVLVIGPNIGRPARSAMIFGLFCRVAFFSPHPILMLTFNHVFMKCPCKVFLHAYIVAYITFDLWLIGETQLLLIRSRYYYQPLLL